MIQHLRSLFKKGDVERRPLLLNNLINDVMSTWLGTDAACSGTSSSTSTSRPGSCWCRATAFSCSRSS